MKVKTTVARGPTYMFNDGGWEGGKDFLVGYKISAKKDISGSKDFVG